MTGQLNMFEILSGLDEYMPGEVEMVSLVPDFIDEPETIEEPEIVEAPETIEEPVEKPEIVEEPETIEKPVSEEKTETVDELEDEKSPERINIAMSRVFEKNGKKVEIAYINYNKVRITTEGEETIIKEFDSTKEAVDYYVEKIQEQDIEE